MKDMKITTSPAGGATLKGGNQHMHSWSGSGEQEPGQTAQEGSGGRRDMGPHAGGSNAGFYSDNSKRGREMNQKHGSNTSFAGTQTPGQSASTPTGDKNAFAKGGTTHMFGNTGSTPAQPGCSSAK
jgi:hypothetical protein